MRSRGLWRWHINITITIFGSISLIVFCLKHNVSETGLCLLRHVEPNHVGPIARAGLLVSGEKDNFYLYCPAE
jgi:hypothetical protein